MQQQKVALIQQDETTVVFITGGDQSYSWERDNLTEDQLEDLQFYLKQEEPLSETDIKEIALIMSPETDYERYREAKYNIDMVEKSYILNLRGDSVYWDGISPLSLPSSLVTAILKAEQDQNIPALEAYQNFWTLMSLNPSEECRKNLFWFLNRHNFKICRQGFFVAYRNADYTSDPNVFTDHHSHTTKISIGTPVNLSRSKCDCDSNHECSRGLHLASPTWLSKNYYGGQGLVCVCNPADVVAVPFNSEYGKLRTCSYLPIDKCSFDEEGKVIPYDVETGFDCSMIAGVIYEGLFGTEEGRYKIEIPELPGFDKTSISDRLLELAKNSIKDKVVG